MTQDTVKGRLSGRQIVVVVVVICTAVVLAPAGVYAAATQKVKVVGTVPTTVQGTVSTSVQGTVPTSVQGTVPVAVQGATTVQGTVTAVPARPPNSFSAFVGSDQTTQSLFGGQSTLYITSITYSSTNGSPSFNWIYDYPDAMCSGANGYVTYATVGASSTVNLVFPTALKVTKTCALFHLGVNVVATVTGYRE
jgi:hypothetical protein